MWKLFVLRLAVAGLGAVCVVTGSGTWLPPSTPVTPVTLTAAQLGDVEVMSEDGKLYTGDAAAREYANLRAQPDMNCGSCRKYVVISAQKMPFIARNISMAFKVGKPFLLRRTANPAAIRANRKASCGAFQPNYEGWCDEYPFASSHEGGIGARIAEVLAREQQCQGGTVVRQYAAQGITEGTQFAVIITDTSTIPATGYTGTDIARREGSAC
jgi:Deoxyribonuclease NucA/NucB